MAAVPASVLHAQANTCLPSTRPCPRPGTEDGFTLLEVMIGMLMLAGVVVIMSQSHMAAISRAGETRDHSLGASWMQAMADYLRGQGYAVTGTWTETAATCAAAEPCLPPGFTRADIVVAATGVVGLKQVSVTLYRRGSTDPFLTLATYVTDLRYP